MPYLARLMRTCPECDDKHWTPDGPVLPSLVRLKPTKTIKDRRWCPTCRIVWGVRIVGGEVWHTDYGVKTKEQAERVRLGET